MWKSPGIEDLREAVATANTHLLLCSPYITRPGLEATAESLPATVSHIDIWTKLSPTDWLVGASQPDGLLDFIQSFQSSGQRTVALRVSERLHAKIILSDGPVAIAGSANLTSGGFGANHEVVRMVRGAELLELRHFVESIRPKLDGVGLAGFRSFVSSCLAKVDSQEALLDLIRGEMPPHDVTARSLIPYSTYIEYLRNSNASQDRDILAIALNLDHNNNSGKVKHAFYGIQRFLQEYPQHLAYVAGLDPDQWFDVRLSPLWADWRSFLDAYESEASDAYQYRMRTLVRTYLTHASGGYLTGGGGGDNELKRAWSSVGRAMTL